ncbi:hypothetical protein NFI96_007989 [Prochilodus magdalenae]|nr:hypothetical protein NFI96_007989 [Prochilodus magdalenae]
MMFLCSLSLFIIMIESCVSQSISPLEEKVDAVEESCVSQSISPLEEKVDAVEGQTGTLSCTYKYTGTAILHWYQQYPGSRPDFLLWIRESDGRVTKAEKLDSRISVQVHKQEKNVELKISSTAVSDSVLYYCALEPTVTRSPSTLYKNSLTDKALRSTDVGGVSTCWNSRTQISPHYLNTGTTMMFLCSLSLFIIMIESCVSQSISPLEVKVNAVEGETVTLSCSYSGSAAYLHWYCQYPGSRPEFLLWIRESDGYVSKAEKLDSRISTTVHKEQKKVELEVSSAAVSDSVLYYCALEPTVTRSPSTLYKNSLTDKALRCVWGFLSESCVSQSISPLEEKVDAVEGETVTLSCRYEYSARVYLHWYRQYPESRPEYLLQIDSGSKNVYRATPPFPRLNVTLDGNKLDLKISSTAVSDSALYYCALEPTVTRSPSTLYKNSLTDKALSTSWFSASSNFLKKHIQHLQ